MIEAVYEELRGIGVVRSSDDFSSSWLGKERSYMRCLRAKQRKPSATALATCAVRLLKSVDGLKYNMAPSMAVRSQRMRKLADRCLEQILVEGARRR